MPKTIAQLRDLISPYWVVQYDCRPAIAKGRDQARHQVSAFHKVTGTTFQVKAKTKARACEEAFIIIKALRGRRV